MKYSIEYTSHFKKKVKLLKKRGYDLTELAKTINILCETGELPREFKPHKLSGKYSGCWENVTSNLIGCLFGNNMTIDL